MKKSNKFWRSLLVIVAFCNITLAQTSLGSSKNFLDHLKRDLKNSSKGAVSSVSLKVSNSMDFQGKVNFEKADATSEVLMGEISNVPQSSFYVKVVGKQVEGHILFFAKKEAYKYSSDAQGNAFVSKVDINTLVCIDYKAAPQSNNVKSNKSAEMKIAPALLNLQSLPGAAGCVMLDFDGYYMPAGNSWNNGNPINAAPSGVSDADLLEQWEVVAEDYRPFNVNITTNEAVFNSYPKNRRMRVVITPTDTAAPGYGGVAYIGSFNWDNDVPCWVFALGGKYGGEATSHEIGHTFDLLHDGRNTTPDHEGYFGGLDGTPWAPIMGVGYYRPVSQWSRGEYNLADNKQDDLASISSAKFGVGYRADDYSNSTTNAAILTSNVSGAINQKGGVITNESDIDFFTFTTAGGNVTLNANTVSRHGDLDIIIRLYNASGTQIASNTTTADGALYASLTTNLAAGKYFLSVDGTGAGNPASGGYSAYASIGSYYITGSFPSGGGGDTQAPTTPTGLIASGTTSSSTNLAWNASTDNVGVTGYDVYRGTTMIATVAGRTYTASGLSASTAYSFSVKAKDAAGNISASSNTVNITTSAGGGNLPFNSGDVFTLTAKHSDKYLTVNANSQDNGGNIDQWTKYPGAKNQQFKFVHLADGFYQLQAMHSGKCADVAGLSLDNGANIQQWDCSGGANQLWKFVSQTDGTYMIISKLSGKALDVAGVSYDDGANVQQWDAYGGDNQKWWINPVTARISSGIATLNSVESEIRIYPNPFTNEFNFNSDSKVLPSDVFLYNVQGKQQPIVIENIGSSNYKVITNTLPQGVYILKISTTGDTKIFKVVKQ
jgi:chitodextrinase